jgi:YHS domain-containing protein
MSVDRPESLIDPVCGMTVNVAKAEANDLLLEHEGRWYAFCRSGCKRAFLEEPAEYVAAAEQAAARAAATAEPAGKALPVIDEGMRRWYESCSCCLGDTYPEIKAQLDAERAAANAGPVDPGICEVADANPQPVQTP